MLRKLLLCTALLAAQICHAQFAGLSTSQSRAEEAFEALVTHSDALGNLTYQADSNSPYANFYLGVAYETGRGVAKNTDLALQFFAAAADKVLEAAFNAGRLLYLTGRVDLAMSYLVVAAGGEKADGMPRAMVLIARIYEQGESSSGRNFVAAGRWYEAAARRKDAEATGKIGEFALYGLGRPVNTKDGKIYLERAADQWNGNAQNLMGEMFAKGIGTGISRTEAAKWFFIEGSHTLDHQRRQSFLAGLTDLERASAQRMSELWMVAHPKYPPVNYLAIVEKAR